MKLGKFPIIALVGCCVILILMSEVESKPFVVSMGQAVGSVFFRIWKAFDNTTPVTESHQNKKRSSASIPKNFEQPSTVS